MAGIRYPRDYSLRTLSLLTATGSVDLRLIANEISYQEDLFNNVISGYVMVTEAQSYAEFFDLTGNEFIHIVFDKNGTYNPKTTIDKWFRVYKIDGRRLSETMYSETYKLDFCSEELLLSEQYKISKAYPNMSVKDVILDICGANGGDGIKTLKIPSSKLKNENIEDTKGLYSFIVPNLKPFDAINWLSIYAQSKNGNVGADMVFFENKDGYNFKSIQTLMQTDTIYNSYHYDPKNIYSPTKANLLEELTNVITYEFLESYDALNSVASGVFANRLISVDVLTRKVISTNFNYFDYSKNAVKLNKYKITNNYINRNNDSINNTSNACLKLVFSNFDQHNPSNATALSAGLNANPSTGFSSIAPNIYAETYIPYRTAQLSLVNHTRIRISVPGDPNLTVGKVINFNLMSNSQNKKSPNNYYSGNYLITAVRHLLDQNQSRTVMEIVKESSPNEYPDPNLQGEWFKAINS
jgi:hypothetical protein